MSSNKKKLIVKIVILVLLITFSVTLGVLGDTGNNVDYSSGSSSSGSHSSSGDSGIFELIFWLIFSELPLPLKLIIIGVLIFIGIKYKSLGGKTINTRGTSYQENSSVVNDCTNEIEWAIKDIDPAFSTRKFLGWTEEVFMTIQQAWTERDWDKIRPFEKEELYRKHQLQLQEYINNNTINIVERINVNQTYLHEYVVDSEYEYLTVYLQARMNDYIVNADTKALVKGNPDKEYHMKYLLTFMRKKGVQTDAATSNLSTKQCPHCGAPLAITSSGKCEYCDTIVTTGEFDWVLADLDSIKKDTNVTKGGIRINN